MLGRYGYVAALCDDPLTGHRGWFVEYVPDELLRADGIDAIRKSLTAEVTTTSVLLRTGPNVVLPSGWHAAVTFIRADLPTLIENDSGAGVIREVASDDEDRVTDWITRALVDGNIARGGPELRDDDVRAVAHGILDSPDRETLVAELDGTLHGHITLQTDQVDVPTGRDVTEVVDILVEPGPGAAMLSRALLAEVARRTPSDTSLIGNVIHPVGTAVQPDLVLDRLLHNGWTLDHRIWEWTT